MAVNQANIFHQFREAVETALQALAGAGVLPEGLDTTRVSVEPPRDPAHGDLSTNAAMVLAKPAGRKPRDIAEALVPHLEALPDVTEVAVAGPGFLNLRLSDDFWRRYIDVILTAGLDFGRSRLGAGQRVNVEYVSANPTGPLHAAHARGAVVGDALARLLGFAGFEVTKEYYINDAGAQVDILARSAYLRYREALGEPIATIPEGYYPGDYLKEVGQKLAAEDGPRWLEAEESVWLPRMRAFAIDAMMADIREDLTLLGVDQDEFTSERELVAAGAVEEAFTELEAQGLIYTGVLEPPKGKKPDDWEPRPQTLFAATRFGDDVDRPLKKSDGNWTYFASDIAYHRDKYRRGFPVLINVWGADHGGYVKRMESAVKAITNGGAVLDVKICQIVHLMDDGKPVRMSKRAGTFITLRDVIQALGAQGRDVVRFIMLTRRNDQTLEFDFKKVTEQSRDNPVFYVQYAHARCHSALRQALEIFPGLFGGVAPEEVNLAIARQFLVKEDLTSLTEPDELALVKQLAAWPRLVETAADTHEPHRVVFYLQELAAAFHALWNRGKEDTALRFILADDRPATLARLALVTAVGTVIATGLNTVIGVDPLKEMR